MKASAHLMAVLALAGPAWLGACTGTIQAPDPNGPDSEKPADKPAANPTDAPGGDSPPMPLAPAEIEQLCTADRPHPRRILRLSNDELVNSYRALAPLPAAGLPDGFQPLTAGRKPDAALAVSRDLHESIDQIAMKVAQSIAAQPGLPCPLADFGADETCTRAFLERQAPRFVRGAPHEDSVAGVILLARGVAQRSGGAAALEYGLRALALSARTLYLSEGLDLPAGTDPAQPTPLSAAELASFLSYRIVGAPPSAPLLAALGKQPVTAERLRALVAEHFSTAAVQQSAVNFWSALLNVSEISTLTSDAMKHPEATSAFFASLQAETLQALTQFSAQPAADLRAAMTTEFASTVARDPGSAAFAALGRPGLFLLPGVLAVVSNTDHTDIPRRGRFLLRQLFCEEVPSPPADATQAQPPPAAMPTERERFERIAQEPRCGGCHERVNHLGFALESYDELGAPRLVDEGGRPLLTGSTHTLPGLPALTFTDARDLLTQAAAHPAAQGCLSLQVFRHFARRGERGADDACLVRDLAHTARPQGFALSALFTDALVRIALAPRAL